MKIIKLPVVVNREKNLKALKILINQYLKGYEKETINKIKNEQ